ncbi:hypothetical protein B0H15DRAFT_949710 [Mycena belliarum]|uniref:Uncharacterized protein n=1 Tax=Mycena belliarum TaxID=1033014 RepID=A0AAD6U833_9AGAR|nr:hypothetical protein B0H15DRAFT_949710 [Mycena belliae]
MCCPLATAPRRLLLLRALDSPPLPPYARTATGAVPSADLTSYCEDRHTAYLSSLRAATPSNRFLLHALSLPLRARTATPVVTLGDPSPAYAYRRSHRAARTLRRHPSRRRRVSLHATLARPHQSRDVLQYDTALRALSTGYGSSLRFADIKTHPIRNRRQPLRSVPLRRHLCRVMAIRLFPLLCLFRLMCNVPSPIVLDSQASIRFLRTCFSSKATKATESNPNFSTTVDMSLTLYVAPWPNHVI